MAIEKEEAHKDTKGLKHTQVEKFEDVVEKLRGMNAKRIFVHFPEGIKIRVLDLSDRFSEAGFDSVLCMERTYGACDVREDEAKRLKCDAIVHVAHEDYGVKTELPIVYWDYFLEVDPIPVLEKEFQKLDKYKNIGLVTSLQFVPALPKVSEYLESRGKKVFLHKSLQFAGQMLGCRIGAGLAIDGKVDAFLCVSAGKFYGLGLAVFTDKPILNLDLERQQIYEIEEMKRRVQKITAWNKSQLNDARKVGLVVSWKRGQMFGNPFKVKQLLEKAGKKVYVLGLDEFSSDKIEGLKLDALVNFCCPRIGTDDLERTRIPLVNWYQIQPEMGIEKT